MTELENITEQKQQQQKRKIFFRVQESTNYFKKFKTIQTSWNTIRNGTITINMANDKQEQSAET